MAKKDEKVQSAPEQVEQSFEEQSEEVKALLAENEALKEMAEQMKETAQRIQAEFDNFRRRSLNDNEQCKVKAAMGVVSAILPALDSIDEAIKLYSTDESKKELYEGFLKIQKQLMDSLSSAGVKAMDCKNAEFNPNLHEAVMMQECEGKESGIIVDVFRKGYTLNDAVVRHAQVIVAK